MKAPPSANEKKRLEVLWHYEVLDTPPEEAFDDLAQLAARICEAPIALISLVDEKRQWFKSRVGLTAQETARDVSFCAQAILQKDITVVPDALKDERFATNPLVTAEPHIRFYAGAPLITPEGHVLGTLCVLDRVPRRLKPDHEEALRILSRHVMTQLELRRRTRELARVQAERDHAEAELQKRVQERAAELARVRTGLPSQMVRPFLAIKIAGMYALAGTLWILLTDKLVVALVSDQATINWLQTLKGWAFIFITAGLMAWGLQRHFRRIRQAEARLTESEERFRLLVSSVKDYAIFMLDSEGRVTSWNAGAERINGYREYEILGRNFSCFYPVEEMLRGKPRRALELAAERGCYEEEGWRVRKNGKEFWASVVITALRDQTGRLRGFAKVTRDITERRQAEEEVRRANRALRAIGECNQAVLRATSEPEFLREICRIIVEEAGYRLAWVGFAEQDEAKTVRPVAQAGYEKGYLETARVSWADTERGRGPVGMAIRTGQHFVVQNIHTEPFFAPWREEAAKRGYASVIALPLLSQGKAFGALAIYAVEPDAFDGPEVALLNDLATDLVLGLTMLRSRGEGRGEV